MAKREWNPGELLEISGFFWKTCLLHTAVKMDVFTVIGDGRLTAGETAQKLDGAVNGVERLLNALVAMELLDKTDDQFSNTTRCRVRAASLCAPTLARVRRRPSRSTWRTHRTVISSGSQ